MSTNRAKTVSESMFEDFCACAGIACTAIDTAETRRPDYEIESGGHRIVIEIKQFDPNEDEAASNRSFAGDGVGGTIIIPGDRIRKAIHSAAPQLKAISRGERPAMLVVYNNSGAMQHTHSYSVATAMHGLDEVPVLVPKDPSISPRFLDARSGRGKKMTANANTTISAIGVLRTAFDDTPILCVHHNPHAEHDRT